MVTSRRCFESTSRCLRKRKDEVYSAGTRATGGREAVRYDYLGLTTTLRVGWGSGYPRRVSAVSSQLPPVIKWVHGKISTKRSTLVKIFACCSFCLVSLITPHVRLNLSDLAS